jgi:NAD(P)-dependent dehydrogenase (short-subunit alcohol dehydrogenase family)
MIKTILITGGSRGIGRATALLCAVRGWNVAINYASDADAAAETLAGVEAAGASGFTLQGDVRDETAMAALFDRTADAFGGIDGVVNNAGIVAPKSCVADMDVERMRRVFETNVLGAYIVAREAARRMPLSRGGRGGSIVNVSSAAARLGSANEYVDYAGSKGAVDTLTMGLADELAADGVRVNAVRPGLIETDIHASGGQPDRAARIGSLTPMGRAGTADEVARTIVWLLGDEASYVTRAFLDVSGGR